MIFRLFNANKKMQSPSLIEKLNSIRPSNEEPSGNCLACSEQTMNVLADAKYSPRVISNKSKKEYQRQEADVLKKENFENHTEILSDNSEAAIIFWKFINELPEGTILLVNKGDDHLFNFVKTSQGKLFLLDSDNKLYKEVRHINDLEHEGCSYFFSDGEHVNSIVFYQVGKIDPVWENQLQKLTSTCTIL